MEEKKKSYYKQSMPLKQALTLAIFSLQNEAAKANDSTWRGEVNQAIKLLRQHKQIVSKA